jgi:hypothetical protein
LFSSLLFAVHGHHGKELERSGGALGHGTGPWDDIAGVVKRGLKRGRLDDIVSVDMNMRRQAVDEWMASRHENCVPPMYWEQPIDTFQASMRSMYRRSNRTH